ICQEKTRKEQKRKKKRNSKDAVKSMASAGRSGEVAPGAGVRYWSEAGMSEEGRGATIDSPEWLRQMECVLETLNEGVLIADDSDRVLFVNAVFEEMTGFSRREIIGKHAGQAYYAPEDFTVIHALRQKARETGRSRQEFFLPTKSGERLPVVISARSVEEPGGRRFAIVTATDISEQKRAQQDLRTVNAQLEARHQEIEQDLILAARIQQSLAPKSLV